MKAKYFMLLCAIAIASCNGPRPVSKDITKTTVTVNGQKDSVINNPQKNYGNATVSGPCVKCILQVIQNTDDQKKTAGAVPAQQLVYDVNWITSTKPKDMSNGHKIINGLEIDVNEKMRGAVKCLAVFLYNNENGTIYTQNGSSGRTLPVNVADSSLKKIRNSCFWGVASAK